MRNLERLGHLVGLRLVGIENAHRASLAGAREARQVTMLDDGTRADERKVKRTVTPKRPVAHRAATFS